MYDNDTRDGEGVLSYPGGRQDVGIWRGKRLTKLKFIIREITLEPKISRHSSLKANNDLQTPDLLSRGNAGPKGYLEVNLLIQNVIVPIRDLMIHSIGHC